MADIADTAISVTEAVGNAARLATKIGGAALPIVQFVAGFFPGAAPLVQVLSIAAPIIERIAIGAPIAVTAINQGRPIIEAIQTAGPQLLSSLKQLYAIAVNNDPARSETNLTADDVSDAEAAAFAGPVLFGRRWTNEETQRWYDRAQGGEAP